MKLADLKRLEVGTKLIMTYHAWGSGYLNVPREIVAKNTQWIKFSNGSYLYYPSAEDFQSNENGFSILQDKSREDFFREDIIRMITDKTLPVYDTQDLSTGLRTEPVEGVQYFIPYKLRNDLLDSYEGRKEKFELLRYEFIGGLK